MHSDSSPTLATVTRYHLCWKQRDLDGIMALYHPDIQYHDFFQHLTLGLAQLRDYVQANLPRNADEALDHSDRIRVDGDTAFIQYTLTLRGAANLVSFRASEAIVVRDGLIWQVNEYAALVRENVADAPRPATARLGLSPRQLGIMAQDLQHYFQHQQPYLNPDLDLQEVARACGYSRNQMSYLLNQVLGQRFYPYVNQARLQHLLRALEQTPNARIDELAFAAGFNSLSAFYKCFRQHTGLSPTAYLKQRK